MPHDDIDSLAADVCVIFCNNIIGSFYNVIADHYVKIWNAVKASDIPLTTKLQRQAVHVIFAGIPGGWSRRPFSNFTEEEEKAQVAKLVAIDEADGIGLDLVKRIKAQ